MSFKSIVQNTEYHNQDVLFNLIAEYYYQDHREINSGLIHSEMLSDLEEGKLQFPDSSNIDQKIDLLIHHLFGFGVKLYEDDTSKVHFIGCYQYIGHRRSFRTELSIDEYKRFWRYLIQDISEESPSSKLNKIILEQEWIKNWDYQSAITMTCSLIKDEFRSVDVPINLIQMIPMLSSYLNDFDDQDQKYNWKKQLLSEISLPKRYRIHLIKSIKGDDRLHFLDEVSEFLKNQIKKRQEYCQHKLFLNFKDLLDPDLVEEHDSIYDGFSPDRCELICDDNSGYSSS